MAAAIWIGTNIVQMILSKPNANVIEATRQKGDFQKVGKVFKPLVDLCVIVLIATGAIIVFNRLTSNYVTVAYVITLGIKVALTAWMLVLLHSERRHMTTINNLSQNSTGSGWFNRTKLILSGYNGLTVVGIVVFFLSDLLRSLFEEILRLN